MDCIIANENGGYYFYDFRTTDSELKAIRGEAESGLRGKTDQAGHHFSFRDSERLIGI